MADNGLPQFDGFLGGWLAGEDVRQTRKLRERADAAYNALRGAYGDVAGDPVSYGQLAGIARNEAAFPLEQEGRRLGNENVAQQTRFLAELQPYSVERAGLTNTGMRQEQQFNAQLQPYTVEAARGGVQDAETQRRQSALLNSVNVLRQVRDRGGDIAQTYDSLLPSLTAAGLNPEELTAARPAIINDPSKLDAIWEALNPVPASVQAAMIRASGGGQAMTPEEKKRQEERGKLAARAEAEVYDLEREAGRAIGGLETITAAPLRSVERLLDPKMIKDTFGFSTLGSYLPTSDWRAANNRLDALKNQIVLQAMQSLKALSPTGSTGFGQLSEREGARLESALGKLDPYTSEEEGRRVLMEVREQLREMPKRAKALLDEEVKQARRKAEDLNTPSSGRGETMDIPAGLDAGEGDVVQSPDGGQYIVRNGKLEPL